MSKKWRVPTKDESLFIYNDIEENGKYSKYEKYFSSSFYWSSTTDVVDTNLAWGVVFYDGGDGCSVKDNNFYVRCVRGYIENGLEIHEEEKLLDWENAMKWAEELNDTPSLCTEEEDCVVLEPQHNTDGGKTNYYNIEGCKDLDDLAEYLNLTPAEFNCIKAIFGISIERNRNIPRHDGGDSLRDAKKLNHYAARIKRTAEREKKEKNRKKRQNNKNE